MERDRSCQTERNGIHVQLSRSPAGLRSSGRVPPCRWDSTLSLWLLWPLTDEMSASPSRLLTVFSLMTIFVAEINLSTPCTPDLELRLLKTSSAWFCKNAKFHAVWCRSVVLLEEHKMVGLLQHTLIKANNISCLGGTPFSHSIGSTTRTLYLITRCGLYTRWWQTSVRSPQFSVSLGRPGAKVLWPWCSFRRKCMPPLDFSG